MARPHLTKTEIIDKIYEDIENEEVKKGDVRDMLDLLTGLIETELGKHHDFVIPGIVKLTVKHVRAKARRYGMNPFTKEEQWFKAKPAKDVIKARALSRAKDSV
jgi:nucleoid DNA-binding protein